MNVLALTLSLVSLLCQLSGCMTQAVRDDNAAGTAPETVASPTAPTNRADVQ